MNKDYIKQKISEALSASFAQQSKDYWDDFISDGECEHGFLNCIQDCPNNHCDKKKAWQIYNWLAAKKTKVESEIKSALETIDWD